MKITTQWGGPKWLDCGCCGIDFKMWPDYKDQDQDEGYGICKRCQGEAEERNEREWEKLEKVMADGLSPPNREKFLAMDMECRRGLCIQAMDDGFITCKIERRG